MSKSSRKANSSRRRRPSGTRPSAALLDPNPPLANFVEGMPLRRSAVRVLSKQVRAKDVPMLADALAAATGPVTELISRTMYPYMELETFRESGKVGEWLTYYSQLAKATVQQLSGDTEEYFCIGDDPDPVRGFVTPQLLTVLFVTYRTYFNSVAERHCYYATPEMTATVFAGSESIDNVSLTLADLPSRTGIAYLHQEDRDRDLILLWAADGEAVLHITLLSAEALAYLLAHEAG